MSQRLAAFVLMLSFGGPTLLGGLVCDGEPGGRGSTMCCALAKSPAASAAMMICCQTLCGKSTGKTPVTRQDSNPKHEHLAGRAKTIEIRFADKPSATQTKVCVRALAGALSRSNPPHLYLSNSAFLI
jgi:hypothetical protein